MSKLVMLNVYSGRPNPVWEVDDGFAQEVLSEANTSERQDGDARLGYRGFVILDGPSSTKEFDAILNEDQSDYAVAARIASDTGVEQRLLETGREANAIDSELFDYVSGAIGDEALFEEKGAEMESITCPPCGGGAAPSYDPGYWNNDPARLRNNNCYNYANNRATNTFAQPGRASGSMAGAMTCSQVQPAAQRDGLTAVSTFAQSRPGVWYVALVVWPLRDYHWYRQDNNGCWSHKPGQTQARNTDNGGNRISDPRTCNRGPYTEFCSYMLTRPGINIR